MYEKRLLKCYQPSVSIEKSYCRKIGFTLFEVLVAMAIFSILSISLYNIINSIIYFTNNVKEEQFHSDELEKLLSMLEKVFFNLHINSKLYVKKFYTTNYQIETALIIENPTGLYGISTLCGGSSMFITKTYDHQHKSLILYLIPPRTTEQQIEKIISSTGIIILSDIHVIEWKLFINNLWNNGIENKVRPQLVGLILETNNMIQPQETIFYLPMF